MCVSTSSSTWHVLFLSCFYFPVLSVSLHGKPSASSIMFLLGKIFDSYQKRNSPVCSPDWYGRHSDALFLIAQKVMAFFVLLNATCTSISHVHRSALVWKWSPLCNLCWHSVICHRACLECFFCNGVSFPVA